jgi:hypothetical protein
MAPGCDSGARDRAGAGWISASSACINLYLPAAPETTWKKRISIFPLTPAAEDAMASIPGTANKSAARKGKAVFTKASARKAAKAAKEAYAKSPRPASWQPGGRDYSRVLGHFGSTRP